VTVEQLIKYLFALDLTIYSGMVSWYIAQMYTLKENDPVLWQEFEDDRSKTPLIIIIIFIRHKSRI